MRIAQRGTSFASSGYTIDRFYLGGSQTSLTLTQSSSSSATGFQNYIKVGRSTGTNTGTVKLPKANKEYTANFLDIKEDINLKLIIELYDDWVVNHPHITSIHIDKEYLNWRITNNPIVKYKIIGVFKNQKLVSFGIINDSTNKAYLLDFIVPKKEDLNHSFIEILRCLKQCDSVSHLIFWASHKNDYSKAIHSLFQSNGAFHYANNNMNFVIKKTEKCTIANIQLEDLYINGLWTEGFKI